MRNLQLSDARWFGSLGAKFARVVPIRTTLVVFLTLIGQISYILAFFLPLKIVILLGSDGMPRYFPPAFAQFDRDWLVVYLSFATVGFFTIHMVVEKITDAVTAGATRSLMARSHKMVLFENQAEIAGNAYQSFSRALAGLVFGLLALLALLTVYVEMALVIGAYIGLTVIGTIVACDKRASILHYVQSNISGLAGSLSAIGFFTVFGYLVVDFVWLEPPGIIVAILSILLGRQVFARVAGAVTGLFKLYQQRQKLDVLFFHGKAFLPASTSMDKSIWDYLSPSKRAQWIRPMLAEYGGLHGATEEGLRQGLMWQQPALGQMGALMYREEGAVFLIKLYARKQTVEAWHEATLLADAPEELPAPEFLGATELGDYQVSLYLLSEGHALAKGQEKEVVTRVLSHLLRIEPPEALVQRYVRSKPVLPYRMRPDWLDMVQIAIRSTRQQKALDALRDDWQALQAAFARLPLTLYSPALKPWVAWETSDGECPLLLHWEKWSLEPIGAGWPTDEKVLSRLDEASRGAAAKRKALHGVSVEQMKLAALIFELERCVQKQQLDDAARLMPRIQSRLGAVNDTGAAEASNW